jgi:uncharacterized membrane protein (UPF0127 family)
VFSRRSFGITWPTTQQTTAHFTRSGAHFDDVLVCASPLLRLRGLLFRDAGVQALLWPCRSVHSFMMAHPIDLIYLSKDGDVVKIEKLGPWRTSSGGRQAFAVLEVIAGSAARLQLGERVSFGKGIA